MIVIMVGLFVCVALAVLVVALVALPARREGRDLLTPRGEDLVDRLRPSSFSSASAAPSAAPSASEPTSKAPAAHH